MTDHADVTQNEIDEFVVDIAKNHHDYSLEQFRSDFKVIMSRDPKFSETRLFQKSINSLKEGETTKKQASAPATHSATPVSSPKDFVEVNGDLFYFERLLPPLSSAYDSGFEITCSSTHSTSYERFFPFSGEKKSWHSKESDVVDSWIRIKLNHSMRFNVLVIKNPFHCMEWSPTMFVVRGSNNGKSFRTLGDEFSFDWKAIGEEQHLYFANDGEYLFYELLFRKNQNGDGATRRTGYICVGLINFGFVSPKK